MADPMEVARTSLQIEADAIQGLISRLDERFDRAVQMILGLQGRLVLCGVGKSGAIARKLAGTFSSTGTPAMYLHPTEAAHGDLGAVNGNDAIVLLSYGGESDEIVTLLPALKRLGSKMIAFTGSLDSSIARSCDFVLDVSVEREACPHNLAPTASAIAMLALGDALALSVMAARGFTPDHFAVNHPAGKLGRQLLLTTHEVMRKEDGLAVVNQDSSVRDVLFAITKAGAGAACVADGKGRFVGLITDGDIRRRLLTDEKALELPASAIMNPTATVIEGNPLALDSLRMFQELPVKIGEAPVLDEDRRPIGMLMLKDLLRAGII
ncbi:MAG: KpsF/GutQ family sugar-phosphate isomerase [Armatimonadetes bacterium]|nr:KpsF/GutQ family sugar-phosphate isomerase [Armatimonadota bacterium]